MGEIIKGPVCFLELDGEALGDTLKNSEKAGDKLLVLCEMCGSHLAVYDDGVTFIEKGDKGCTKPDVKHPSVYERQAKIDLRALGIKF